MRDKNIWLFGNILLANAISEKEMEEVKKKLAKSTICELITRQSDLLDQREKEIEELKHILELAEIENINLKSEIKRIKDNIEIAINTLKD